MYAIRNKETGEWFKCPRGVVVRARKNGLGNAWNNVHGDTWRNKRPNFSEQDVWEIVEVELKVHGEA